MARENTLSVSFFLQPIGFQTVPVNEREQVEQSRKPRTDILIPTSFFGNRRSNKTNEGKTA